MNDWRIVLIHTHKSTLLQRAFETAFPGRVTSMFVPELGRTRKAFVRKGTLVDYFRREIFDSGLWNGRVLTVYGDGNFHHWTYALTKLALERRGLGDWTYFHFDQHRDDWGKRGKEGLIPTLNCAAFVDQLVHDHGATPYMVGPDVYPRKDSQGYKIGGKRIPIFSNYFTQALQQSRSWPHNRTPDYQSGLELPVAADLRATPTESYLSFDLDLLSHSEIVTNYDQNDAMTLRRLCQILDRIRPHKRVFSADLLGFPDWNKHHTLSCLTMIILARKVMGLGVKRLLKLHTLIKRQQAAQINRPHGDSAWDGWNYWDRLGEEERKIPIEVEEFMEVLAWTQ